MKEKIILIVPDKWKSDVSQILLNSSKQRKNQLAKIITKYSLLFTVIMFCTGSSFALSKGSVVGAKTIMGTTTSTINGAYGDGIHDDTKAIQAALDSVSAAGGGVVLFANGKYLTGPLVINSNDTLEVDSSGAIIGTTDMASYYKPGADTTKPPSSLQPLLTANYVNNIAIIGKGYIDGQGQEWWTAYNNGTISVRPRMFQPNHCNNILLKNITLKNSPQFHFIPEWCNNITVDSVTILAPSNSPNTDGIDPATCHNVHITNCYVDNGDDDIAVKSGNPDPNDPNAACTQIYISHCTFIHGHGVSIGSETGGGVDSMYVDSCTFNGTTNGIRIKSYRGDGGNVRNINYSNITMTGVKYPIYFSEYYPSIPAQTDPAQMVTALTPQFHDITVTNLTATNSTYAGVVVGLPEMFLKNIKFNNVSISASNKLELRNTYLDTANTSITPGINYEIGGTVTDVINDNHTSQVTNYTLFQNYPNPFNPSTTIKYTVPREGLVTIKVYNVIGNLVATLSNEVKAAGSYSIKLSADKIKLASGVYFYRMQAGNFADTKKFILLK